MLTSFFKTNISLFVQVQKKTVDYTPSGDDHIQGPDPGTRGPYGIYCKLCETVKARQPSDFYRHLAETHYKAHLARYLPPPGTASPYRCPLCPYENKEMSPMIRHFGVAHKKVKEAIGNQVVGKYVPESQMAPSRPALKGHNSSMSHHAYAPVTAPPMQQHHHQPMVNHHGHHLSHQPLYHEPPPTPLSVEPPSPQSPAAPAVSAGGGGGSSNISVKCPYDDCDMEFSARYAFWQHMCDKHLKEELLRQIPHTPAQPYQCPAPGCAYNTKDSRQALVRHYGMTHKVVQTLLSHKFPEFTATDKFAAPPKAVPPTAMSGGSGALVRPRAKTPVRGGPGMMMTSSFAPYQQHHQQPQSYIQHQGQPHIQQVAHLAHQQDNTLHYVAAPPQYHHHQAPAHIVSYSQQQQQPYHDQFDLNLDSLNPSDFSIPSLSEFLDNPAASFPNLTGEDLAGGGSSYITTTSSGGQQHLLHHQHGSMQQFEPGQMDGTFDPTSIGDQSLDGSAGGGSNPTTPEKNSSSSSRANLSPAVVAAANFSSGGGGLASAAAAAASSPVAAALMQKKFCEICGKEYEGKNRSMNKVCTDIEQY
jgi:hypothetical protein